MTSAILMHPWVAVLAVIHSAAFVLTVPAVRTPVSVTPAAAAPKTRLDRFIDAGTVVFIAAFAVNTFVLLDRWFEAGRPPFKTLFETMLFYPWCVALVTGVLVALHGLRVLIPFSAAISVFGLGWALTHPDLEIINLPPALQSGWFVPHVVTYFISYAGLFASAVFAAMALWRYRRPAGDPKVAAALDKHAHDAAKFGFVALTFGLVMGSAWGKAAWGDYWGWDPKENWALVSWLAYLGYFHVRLLKGWRGQKAMIVCAGAFAAVVFTYLGMSLLPTAEGSLHVYQ